MEMTDAGNPVFLNAARGDWVRLRTLVMLRWMAVCGQAIAVLTADLLLDLDLPVGVCFAAIAASVCFNLVAQIVHPETKRLSERDTMLTLMFDLAQLGVLLFLCGGLTNPFAVLVLAPVTISATALTLRSTLLIGLAAAIEISILSWGYFPLTFSDGTVLDAPPLFVLGMWAALLITVVFLAAYARRITAEIFTMSQALSATQEALSREQRLTAIGGLAAAAAHELGTPLATIKLVSGELARELEDHPELKDDFDLIRKQAERCRDILRELSQGGRDDSHVKAAPVSAIVEEAAEPHRDRGKRIIIRLDGDLVEDAREDQPIVNRRPEMIHGLRNLVQNAVDFSRSTVWIDVEWTEETLRIVVGDDGPGYGADMLGRLGDPYVTNRARRGLGGRARGARPGYEGMGLGLFIAKTLLERTGARVEFANGADRDARAEGDDAPAELTRPAGAIVITQWPRAVLTPEHALGRGALGDNPRFSLSNI